MRYQDSGFNPFDYNSNSWRARNNIKVYKKIKQGDNNQNMQLHKAYFVKNKQTEVVTRNFSSSVHVFGTVAFLFLGGKNNGNL